ncbi:hypothetical protein PHLGIDRAFT_72682 [Phlebiopsis gigantea 11061_1 CR5-6]|uniref:DUF6533 domain-containing protein n=1 Tax=Phlebiopsis gigantea (strain 11061_1 CR5-6) TaxID=745531 RepID=A0A0C3S9T6_PHLG1|nr:hypothetical protein PHLGIDRAFT_72682 [Phlebiopsis gigantea 11061_1 CR5-6]
MWIRNSTIATAALVVYDAVLTLQREVNYVWRQKFAGATVIYLLNRYAYVAIPLLELVQTDTIHDDRVSSLRYLGFPKPDHVAPEVQLHKRLFD